MRHGSDISYREAMLIQQGWGDRENKTRSYRWPKRLIERVDRIAKETMNDPTEALFHLVQWACEEYDHQRESEQKDRMAGKRAAAEK